MVYKSYSKISELTQGIDEGVVLELLIRYFLQSPLTIQSLLALIFWCVKETPQLLPSSPMHLPLQVYIGTTAGSNLSSIPTFEAKSKIWFSSDKENITSHTHLSVGDDVGM